MTQKFLSLVFGFALALGGCVEAPPASVDNNVQISTNNATNNATNSDTNNSSTIIPPEFEPFSVADGLVLHFLFEAQPIEPLFVENSAPGFMQRRLQLPPEATIQNGRLSLNRQTAVVTLPEQVLEEAVNSGEFTAELWWEHSGSDSGTLLKLSDTILIQRSGRSQITMRLGTENYNLREVDLGPMSHLVLTSDVDSMRLYVDGFLVWARARATEALNVLTLVPAIELGSRNGAYIDIQQFSFYTRALTQAEIAMHTMVGPGTKEWKAARNDTFALAFRDSSTHNNVLKRVIQTSVRDGLENVDRLDFSPEGTAAAPLLLLNHDLSELPPEARLLHGYLRLETTSLTTELPDQSFQISAFVLLRLWDPLTVAWDSPWTEAGITGAADRAETPFYTSDTFSFPAIVEPNTARFLIDTTQLIESWLEGENYGILLDAEGIGRGGFGNVEHLRAAFMILGVGAPVADSTFPSVVVRADTSEQCFVEHDATLHPTNALEVWQDKNLVAVSSGNSIQIRNCVDPATIEVSGLDAFGNSYWGLEVSWD